MTIRQLERSFGLTVLVAAIALALMLACWALWAKLDRTNLQHSAERAAMSERHSAEVATMAQRIKDLESRDDNKAAVMFQKQLEDVKNE